MGVHINQWFIQRLAVAVLSVALLFPGFARAVGIGDIVLQSKLGEPLFAQVELRTAVDENIDASCLSLAAPDPNDDEAGNYLLNAGLDIKTEGARRYVVISSRKPLNEAFAKLRLQVNCPGMGSIVKTLTVLPGLETMPLATMAASATRTTARGLFAGEDIAPKATPYAKTSHAQTSGKKQEPLARFWLKISGEPMDESRVGNVSLGKQLSDELDGMKLRLAWLISVQSAAATLAASVAATPQSIVEPADQRPVVALNKAPVTLRQDNPLLQHGLLAAGLALFITILARLLRRHIKLNSREAAKGRLDIQQAANEAKRTLNEKRTLVYKFR